MYCHLQTGIGVLIYQNIDTIGHLVILAILLVVTIVVLLFCFKNANGFHRGETSFDNPIYDYIILAALLLGCIFRLSTISIRGFFIFTLRFNLNPNSTWTILRLLF
jgi:hypothetical protein